ncbi:MAG: hypothetical protein HY699_19810 [Deltaproteobacteria bacterium]|nr:hypothetical protein [Deltaproteobacteria bacterium]
MRRGNAKRERSGGGSPLSLKLQRQLHAWRVEQALAAGESVVVVEKTYRLRDGQLATLAFDRDDEGRLCVGYAVDEGGWVMVESEPVSVRTLGYYQRWLKRHREWEERPER